MAQSEFLRRSGRAFIAAAFAFITILSGTDPIAIPGSIIAAALMAVAISSLDSAYRDAVGPFGRGALVLGRFSPLIWLLVMAVFIIRMDLYPMEQGWWVAIFAGPAIALLGLSLFGLDALGRNPMRRMNWLPLLAGIWYPATFAIFSVYDISHHGVFPEQFLPALIAASVIQFLALCWLGITLIQESARAAPSVLSSQ